MAVSSGWTVPYSEEGGRRMEGREDCVREEGGTDSSYEGGSREDSVRGLLQCA